MPNYIQSTYCAGLSVVVDCAESSVSGRNSYPNSGVNAKPSGPRQNARLIAEHIKIIGCGSLLVLYLILHLFRASKAWA
jgi:hypothetical protein